MKIPLDGIAPANNGVHEYSLHHNVRLTVSSTRNPGLQTYLDDTQLAYGSLDSQLLTSSLRQSQYDSISHNSQARELPQAEAGGKRKRNPELEHMARSNSSIGGSDQAGNDGNTASPTRENLTAANGSTTSSYLKSPELNRATKTTKLGVHLTRVSSESVVSDRALRVPVTPLGVLEGVQLARPDDNTAEQGGDSPSGEQSTSELPTAYSLSDLTSGSSKVRLNVSQRSMSDPGPQIGSISPKALRPIPTPRKARTTR